MNERPAGIRRRDKAPGCWSCGLLELYDDALPQVYGFARAAFRRAYQQQEGRDD